MVEKAAYLSHHTEEDLRKMLEAVGVSSPMDLYSDIPSKYILPSPPALGPGLSEQEVVEKIRGILGKNSGGLKLFIGGGVWPHYVPAAVKEIVSRSEFLTSYTPYQPEASQGMLTALFEFQSLAADLYGVDVVNSSMYDWATALGEALRMAVRYNGRNKVLVVELCSPERLRVAKTYTQPLGIKIETVSVDYKAFVDEESLKNTIDSETSAVYVENPSYVGAVVRNVRAVGEIAHDAGALFVVGAEPTSLGLFTPPGEYGADVVVGEGQPIGLPMSFGGPLLGILGCRYERRLVHSMPGRLVGMTESLTDGKRAFTMILRAREQDIKREKATSNICTNQALCAVAAAAYLSLLGKSGLRDLARLIFDKTSYFIEKLKNSQGVRIPLIEAPHYMEFAYRVEGVECSRVLEHLLEHGIVGGLKLGPGYPKLDEAILTAVTEVHSRQDVDSYVKLLKEVG